MAAAECRSALTPGKQRNHAQEIGHAIALRARLLFVCNRVAAIRRAI